LGQGKTRRLYRFSGTAAARVERLRWFSEYHYEYTACDSSGSRWRVAVPHAPGLCTGLPDPVKGTECSFSCKAGEFLDMKAQACQPCAEGTYSLGTGVRFDEWDEVPRGFANVAANLEAGDGFGDSPANCTVELSRGNNVLYWRTTAFSVWTKVPKPVLLRNVGITGVAYTSECFPCKPGTFAAAAGSSFCRLCPADTFSGKGAAACQPCEPAAYAEPGSASCKLRPPCTAEDYFYTHTACDGDGQTQLLFKWAEPKTCSEELPRAAKLPPSGAKTACPPCNPGFFKSNASSCEPCPYGSYSNGSGCASCPAGTEPVLGLEYKWWNTLPPNMETTVLSGVNFEYKGMAGWEVAGDYIYTVAGASDNDFMILTLVVPGFSPPQPAPEEAESKEVARITFVFETVCSVGCELYFMVGVNSRSNTPVETWTGAKGKQSYTYVVEKNATTSFTWAFQRGDTSFPGHPGRATVSSPGRVTPAPLATLEGRRQPATGADCNVARPQARSLCYNDCSFSLALPGRALRYDFSALATATTFTSAPSFTSKGLKYFHHFNISLCGNHGRKMASCADNVTDARAAEPGSSRLVTSYVCQAVVVPSDVVGYRGAVSSQPVSLADRLVGVTAGPALDGIVSPPEHFAPAGAELPDVVFFFRWARGRGGSNEVTQSCGAGRATTIRLRSLSPSLRDLSGPCSGGCCGGVRWCVTERRRAGRTRASGRLMQSCRRFAPVLVGSALPLGRALGLFQRCVCRALFPACV
uniref:KIAA1324 n=1 Tax=Apteryx owenii TaxID=8824 RepID=A0A8B9PTK3_APTOW